MQLCKHAHCAMGCAQALLDKACGTPPVTELLSQSLQCAGALWECHDLVRTAHGNHANCQQLDLYSQDVLRVFDAEGAHRLRAAGALLSDCELALTSLSLTSELSSTTQLGC